MWTHGSCTTKVSTVPLPFCTNPAQQAPAPSHCQILGSILHAAVSHTHWLLLHVQCNACPPLSPHTQPLPPHPDLSFPLVSSSRRFCSPIKLAALAWYGKAINLGNGLQELAGLDWFGKTVDFGFGPSEHPREPFHHSKVIEHELKAASH